MDDRILVLWATPRSTSTAFEWMMRRRGDFVCLHEPFGQAYYRGSDRRTTRLDENELDPTRSYVSTWREILAARRGGRVFSKDFPNYVGHLPDDARDRDGSGVPAAAEFLPDALQWETGDRREVRWYGGRWHDALSASMGLRRQDRRHAGTVDDVPFLRELERRCRPHYEALAAYKLSPVGVDG